MRFSEWIKRKLNESLNPELERLKREEKLLLMSIEGRKDSKGMVHGINKAGVIDAMAKLKEVREKIKALEMPKSDPGKVGQVPAWLRGKEAV